MSQTISTAELVHLVIEEIWNRGELELADALFTHDYVNHGGLIPDLVRGPEAIKLSVALYRTGFPTFQVAVDELSTDKGAIVVRWVAHRGPPPLVDGPSSRKGCVRGITRCRLRDGKIAESWTVWDSRAALVRWGAVKQDFESREARSASRTECREVAERDRTWRLESHDANPHQ